MGKLIVGGGCFQSSIIDDLCSPFTIIRIDKREINMFECISISVYYIFYVF